MTDAAPLTLARDGAERLTGGASQALAELRALSDGLPVPRGGLRLRGVPALTALLGDDGTIGSVAARHLGSGCRAVRALLFDKRADANWTLGWHQDRVICVAERLPVDGFTAWTHKDGQLHVQPPFALLTGMLTVRVHLDDTPADNAPLLIAPGSHRLGRVPVDRIEAAVATCGVRACLAVAGDIWLYATPILHASDRARRSSRRRVIQVDFAAAPLPGGLRWSGV